MKMTMAKVKKAMKALALMSGCRFWNSFTRNRPPMMNMNAVSAASRRKWHKMRKLKGKNNNKALHMPEGTRNKPNKIRYSVSTNCQAYAISFPYS